MIGLSPAERAAARAEFDAAVLPETCTLRRRPSPGAPWADVPGAGGIAGRLSLGSGGNVQALSQIASSVDADGVLRLSHGTDVRRGDRARVAGEAGDVLCEVLFVGPAVRIHRNAAIRVVESA